METKILLGQRARPSWAKNRERDESQRFKKPPEKDLRLRDDIPQIRPVELVAHLDDALVVDLARDGDAGGVDLEHLEPPHLVRERDLDLAVEPAGAQQGRVERVGPVRGHNDLGAAEVVEAVELVQQFHQRALDLAVGRGALAEASPADGVDLVHEDDARLVLLGVPEQLPDQPRRLANVLVDDRGRDDFLYDVVSSFSYTVIHIGG